MQIKFLLLALFWSGDGAGCKHVHDVQVRAVDERDTLKDMVLKFAADMDQLRTKVDILGRQSAFMARFSSTEPVSPASGPFKFDTVVFNTGNNYDPTLGVFTAPYTGIYTFSVQVYGRGHHNTHILYDVIVNGEQYSRTISQGVPTFDVSVPVTVNARLQKGDRVWVQTGHGLVYALYGSYHAHFSGALISADTC